MRGDTNVPNQGKNKKKSTAKTSQIPRNQLDNTDSEAQNTQPNINLRQRPIVEEGSRVSRQKKQHISLRIKKSNSMKKKGKKRNDIKT